MRQSRKRNLPVLFSMLALCTLGLSGCYGHQDYYGGGYYGYPGGWGRQGWNNGYNVGPHYTGRGWGGPGYRGRYNSLRPGRPGFSRGNFNHGPGGYRR